MVLAQYSCTEKVEAHISTTIVFEGKLYKLEQNVPFSGKIFNTYQSGKREYEGEYSKGKPNGLLVYWYENGNKMREGKLKNGSPIGRWNYYNKDGILKKAVDY